MDKLIVDTDVLIEYLRKNREVSEFLNEVVLFENILITYVSKIEIFKGAINKKHLQVLESVLSSIPVLLNSKIASEYTVSLIEKYHLSHNLKFSDATIASICSNHKLPLLTLNTKDFKFISGLKLIDHNLKPLPR